MIRVFSYYYRNNITIALTRFSFNHNKNSFTLYLAVVTLSSYTSVGYCYYLTITRRKCLRYGAVTGYSKNSYLTTMTTEEGLLLKKKNLL